MYSLSVIKAISERPETNYAFDFRLATRNGSLVDKKQLAEFGWVDASRLRRNGLYSEGARIIIVLGNSQDRELRISDSWRMPFSEAKQTQATEIIIERNVTAEDLDEAPADCSLSMILELFDHFGWNPDPSLISTDQTRFYEKAC
jgi:hypothetical protein